ncbi:30S ribosomal protein S4 [Candidatus Woesearchaeota archaeon]|nr:30S ribosomal protein S4 [Candidatus Woesearchaeota archaeon]
MGDPKKIRKKYTTPSHPWQRSNLENEARLVKEYGLIRKKEVWKVNSLLKKIKAEVKEIAASEGEKAEKDKNLLLKKLKSWGLLKPEQGIDDVLVLETKDLMERRLQTLVFKKGMSKSIDQARQFIVHGHIKVGDKKMNTPSYMVKTGEEDLIGFIGRSSLSDPEHPERVSKKEKKLIKEEPKAEEKSTEENKDEKTEDKKQESNEK